MKRMVLCFDGTWNAVRDPAEATNVVKFANALSVTSQDGLSQIVYYNSGVGSGGPIDRFLGGVFGAGLRNNVKRGLAFLALNYDEGDEIYIFGFSRGAYTARALAGVIGVAGIPLDFSRSEIHWNCYRDLTKINLELSKLKPRSRKAQQLSAKHDELQKKLEELSRYRGMPIQCVAVWDTVGSYGIPGGPGRALTSWTYGFRDTQLSERVKIGLHAVAIDETRRPFAPTFWTGEAIPPQGQDVEQVWFAGAHSNVGGGYENCGLSDLALAWMIARVSEKTKLKFNEEYLAEELWPCSACTLYRSGRGWLLSSVRPYVRSVLPRRTRSRLARMMSILGGRLAPRESRDNERVNEQVHWSVLERRAWPVVLVEGIKNRKYAPRNLPPTVEQVAKPSKEELRLIALIRARKTRNGRERCSLVRAGLPCQCLAGRAADAAAPQVSAQAA
jgi:hypothetical protein